MPIKIKIPRNLNTNIPCQVPCPYCGEPNDEISGEGKPKPNDIVICFECGEPAILQEDGTQRKITDTERQLFENTGTMRLVRHMIEIAKQMSSAGRRRLLQ